jgi:hypothetical protein
MNKSLKSHLEEIAWETGIDTQSYHSREKLYKYKGFEIESFYDEDASSAFSAWGAFAKGIGSRMRPSREEALEAIKSLIDKEIS